MAEDWQTLQTEIASDLRADGQEFTFLRPGHGEFDPIAGKYSPAEEQRFTAYGIFKSLGSLSLNSNYSFEWQQETTIRIGDKLLMVDGLNYSPQAGDFLVLDSGEKWAVVSWALLDPSGLSLLQYLLLRRA